MIDGNSFGRMVLDVGSVPEGNTMIHVEIWESTSGEQISRKIQVSRTFTNGRGETVHRSLGRVSSAAAYDLASALLVASTALAEMERPAPAPAPAKSKRSRKRKESAAASA